MELRKFAVLLSGLAVVSAVGCTEAQSPQPLAEESFVAARKSYKTDEFFPRHKVRKPAKGDKNGNTTYAGPLGDMAALLRVPKGEGPFPAIICLSGGDDSNWIPNPASPDYSGDGIVTMFPALRGANGNPGRPEELYGEVDDVLGAIDFLKQHESVDPDRIFLAGHSVGGTLALLVAAASEDLRCVFSFGPADNVERYGWRMDKEESKLRSPIRWVHQIKPTTYVIEGMVEPNNYRVLKSLVTFSKGRVQSMAAFGCDHFTVPSRLRSLIAKKIVADDVVLTQEEVTEYLRKTCLLYTSPSPRDQRGSRMPSSA